MIQEAYVSFEIAKLLKEKGFNEPTKKVWYEHVPSYNVAHKREAGSKKLDYFYWDENTERNSLYKNDTNEKGMPTYITGKVYSAPTHQMAMAWLREVHDIFIEISVDEMLRDEGYQWALYYNSTKEIRPYSGWVDSYEEAVEAALKYCLEKLI